VSASTPSAGAGETQSKRMPLSPNSCHMGSRGPGRDSGGRGDVPDCCSWFPDGIIAVGLSEPTDSLETCLVWRTDETSPRSGGIRGGRRGLRDRDRLRLAPYAVRVGPRHHRP
jgi:hypothetical protein